MILDFLILEDVNPERILFLDTSEYDVVPTSPTLHIKFPDIKKEYSVPIEFGTINIINTAKIKLTDCNIDFQDGAYEFNYTTATCSDKKKVYITTQANRKLKNALINFDYTNKDLLEKFNIINLYLQGAKAIVSTNETQADALYKQADNLLKCL